VISIICAIADFYLLFLAHNDRKIIEENAVINKIEAYNLSNRKTNSPQKPETDDKFSFEDFFDAKTMQYCDNENKPYFLAISSDNSPAYIIKKAQIIQSQINTIRIDSCTIKTHNGDIAYLDNEPDITDCSYFNIKEDNSSITIESKYETPIVSSKISVRNNHRTYTIPAYNTIVFTKKYPLRPSLWEIDKKYNRILEDRIVFVKPSIRTYNLLSLEKNISHNYTILLKIEPSNGNRYACPYILLNNEVSIDFGHDNGNTILVRYQAMSAKKIVDKQLSLKIDKKILSDFYKLTLTKSDQHLQIAVSSQHGNPSFYCDGVFRPKRWSNFAIGNIKDKPGFELQDIAIIGKNDE